MSQDWNLVPLKELLIKSDNWIEVNPAQTYKQITVKIWGKGVVLRNEVTGTQISASKRLEVKSGQFILSRIDARHGAFGLIPDFLDKGIVTNDFPIFSVNTNRMIPAFLEWMSKTANFIELCQASSEGTTNRVRLKENKFLSMKIPLPPLEEQQRIVLKVEELAGKIEEVRGLRDEALRDAEALLGSAIYKIFDSYKVDNFSELKLGDYVICDCYGTSEKALDYPSGTPVLRMGNIQDGKLDISDLKYMFLSEKDKEKLLIQKGDILVNRTNSAQLVGKCAVFDLDDEYVFASYIIRLRLDLTKAIPKLVASYINSPIGRNYMFNERKQMTGQANINAKKLKALPINLPPIEKQQKIVTYLDSLQSKINEMKQLREKAIQELDALLPSILDKAFKGEL